MTSKIIMITAIAIFLILAACATRPEIPPQPTSNTPTLIDLEAIGLVETHARVLASQASSPTNAGLSLDCITDYGTNLVEFHTQYKGEAGYWIVTSASHCTFIVDDKTGVVTSQ